MSALSAMNRRNNNVFPIGPVKVEYMAPELVKGQKYSVAVDWWSYGILVYEMMCTRTPFFHQKGRKAIFQGIIKSDPQYPMHFSAPSQDFISKLLAKEVGHSLSQ